MDNEYDKIIGIDPGNGGGIATWCGGIARVGKMPIKPRILKSGKKRNETNINSFKSILESHKLDYHPIIFLELVQPWTGKDDPARQFAISRMLANYESLKTVVITCGIDLIVVRPQEWQSYLNLKVKGEKPEERKQRYKRFAGIKYPDVKVTLWNADALCLVEFGRRKVAWDQAWIRERLPSKEQQYAF